MTSHLLLIGMEYPRKFSNRQFGGSSNGCNPFLNTTSFGNVQPVLNTSPALESCYESSLFSTFKSPSRQMTNNKIVSNVSKWGWRNSEGASLPERDLSPPNGYNNVDVEDMDCDINERPSQCTATSLNSAATSEPFRKSPSSLFSEYRFQISDTPVLPVGDSSSRSLMATFDPNFHRFPPFRPTSFPTRSPTIELESLKLRRRNSYFQFTTIPKSNCRTIEHVGHGEESYSDGDMEIIDSPPPPKHGQPEPHIPDTSNNKFLKKTLISAPKRRRCPCTSFRCGFVASSLTILAAVAAMAIVYDNTKLVKCVDNFDMSALEEDLGRRVHGQHVAVAIVTSALSDFLYDNRSDVLVMSFHGWTGIGKNHMSNVIASHLPSSSVNRYIVPLHFPHASEDDCNNIRSWIISNISSSCGIHLFIIDEIDKASAGLVRSLHRTLEDARRVRLFAGKSSRIVVLLLSNTGSAGINSFTLNHLMSGRPREEVAYSDILPVLHDPQEAAWYSEMLAENQVDFLVPFLPLEKRHVRKCVEAEMEARGRTATVEVVESVLERLSYFPPGSGLFSAAGCRKVSPQVDLLLD